MKIALLGAWHVHASGYVRQALDNGAEVIGCWDEDAAKAQPIADKYGLPIYESREALLASDAEGVIICSSSDRHTEDILAAAKSGKDIFTEKVLALTTEECLQIRAAVEEAGVRFVISLVQKFTAGPTTVKEIVDNGEIGTINYLRFRNCHNGSTGNWLPLHFFNAKECGGGAMIDLGAHGMYLTDWFLGIPESAVSTFTVFDDNPLNTDHLEDNAVTLMKYKNGCIAINETGFVSVGCPMRLEIGGTDGYVVFEGDTVTKNIRGEKSIVPMKEALPSPLTQFVTGKILPGCGMESALNLTKLMEMAYQR